MSLSMKRSRIFSYVLPMVPLCLLTACEKAQEPQAGNGIIVDYVESKQAKAKQARTIEAIGLAAMAQGAIQSHYMLRGKWPVDNETAGLSAPGAYRSENIERLEIDATDAAPKVTITFTEQVAAGQTLVWVGEENGGRLTWTCTGGSLDTAYRPPVCR